MCGGGGGGVVAVVGVDVVDDAVDVAVAVVVAVVVAVDVLDFDVEELSYFERLPFQRRSDLALYPLWPMLVRLKVDARIDRRGRCFVDASLFVPIF